jgi:hypothetical protein
MHSTTQLTKFCFSSPTSQKNLANQSRQQKATHKDINMFRTGLRLVTENVRAFAEQEDAARHHAASPENLRIMAKYQNIHDTAIEAHAAGKVQSPREAIGPLLEVSGLVPTDPMIDRDFLNG